MPGLMSLPRTSIRGHPWIAGAATPDSIRGRNDRRKKVVLLQFPSPLAVENPVHETGKHAQPKLAINPTGVFHFAWFLISNWFQVTRISRPGTG